MRVALLMSCQARGPIPRVARRNLKLFHVRRISARAIRTADKAYMFFNGCPSSIEGKTNDAERAPE